MTTQGKSLEELGRRAAACKHWRWMPGMYLLPHAEGCPGECCEDRDEPRRAGLIPVIAPNAYSLPDFSKPSTLGCLLALVEDAYGTCDLGGRGHPSDLGFTHRVFPYDHDACFEGRTRAEALVVALEAAP